MTDDNDDDSDYDGRDDDDDDVCVWSFSCLGFYQSIQPIDWHLEQ